jgi:hypothetical protein
MPTPPPRSDSMRRRMRKSSGNSCSVVAHYLDGHGTGEQVAGAATAAVTDLNDALTGAVTIGGTATQGQTLTAFSRRDAWPVRAVCERVFFLGH